MAHELQERYSGLIDEKLRATLVTKDNYIFNNRYEGNPKSGKVKIPVRDTEVAVRDYSKANGLSLQSGSTTYLDLDLNKDKAVNEIIDGFDAAAVPDGIIAERLDSAAYGLSADIDAESIKCLEDSGTAVSDTTAVTGSSAYAAVVALRTAQSKAHVPKEGRWLIVSPEVYGTLLLDDHFIREGDLSQEMKNSGAIGAIAGYAVYESERLSEDVEMIAGHPNWCHRVEEWEVPVAIKQLTNTYIGASAVQGRKIYGVKVSKPETVLIKRSA
ncbi:MAG: hypothetical protein Q4G33_10025 [bacterium]|nr:hypothetical protein [bacterium]